MKKSLLILLAFLLFSFQSLKSQTWSTIANKPTPTEASASAVIGNTIYLVGGSNTCEAYNTVTNTWSVKANLNVGRGELVAASVNGKIYAIGGYNGSAQNICEEYDPILNTWTIKAPMPTSRSVISGAVIENKIYVVGGWPGNYGTLEVYDPATNTWTTKAPCPNGRLQFNSCAVLNNKLYFIGGPYYAGVNVYDPASNTWALASNLPSPRFSGAACVVDNEIHYTGGVNGGVYTPSFPNERTHYVYNSVTNTWRTELALPQKRSRHISETVNGKIYVIGGFDSTLTLTNTNYVYNPACIANITNNDTTICKSSSVTLSAATAIGNTYLWSNNATASTITVSPIATTKYYCTVINGTTTCKDSVTVTVSTIATNIITADTVKACGTSASVTAITGLSSYIWSNGATTQATSVTSTGWYKCTATNGACTAKDSVYVSLFNPKIVQNDTTVCSGSSLTMNLNTAIPTSVSDIDGNQYPISKIGTQLWLGQNLRTSRFANGDSIPEINNGTTWYFTTNTSSPARCSVDLNPSNDNGYGRMYNFYAITDNRNVCPIDWHASTDEEWNTMVKYIEPSAVVDTNGNQSRIAGFKLRDTLQTYWSYSGVGAATNQTGFSVRAAGARQYYGNFYGVGNYALYWTTKSLSQYHGYYRLIGGGNVGDVYRLATEGIDNKSNGYSVRCLRNQPAILENCTYLWSTGATTPSISVSPTATTSYIATVSNGINTCKDTVKITVNALPTNIITADTVKVCGTSTTINANTGFATYNWSNGSNTASTNISTSGWYKCTVTNAAGCSGMDSVYVSLFNPKIAQNDTTVCAGSNLTLSVNASASSSALPNNLRNGLVGYWPFNGNANDESGNGNNGTVNGATLTTDRFGNVGKAYSFNGINNYIRVPNGNSINVIGNEISIGMWINSINLLNDSTFKGLSKGGYFVGSGYELLFRNSFNGDNGVIDFTGGGLYQATDAGYNVNSRYGQWFHVAVVFSNGVTKIYVDGIQQPTLGNGNTTLISNLSDLLIGTRNTSNNLIGYLKGKMDDIAIYNRAISASEVQQLYSGASSILWSTGATTPTITVSPIATTSYIATVSNGINTCKDTVKITVTTINANFITLDTVKACGTSITVNATTGFASYLWSNGATTASTNVSSSGWYKCTITNGVCTAVDSVYVSLFNPKITQNDTTVCGGTSLTLSINNTASSSVLPTNLRSGLVGYWPFNGNANDESGNGNNGTVNGATLTTDRFGNGGKAYEFYNLSQIGGYIRTPNILLGDTFTITSKVFWYNNNVSNASSLVSNHDGTLGYELNIIYSVVREHYSNVNNAHFTDSTIPYNEWHQITWVKTGSTSKLYLDSRLISVKSNISIISNSSVGLFFGRAGWGGNILKGKMDDIAIYNRALSSTEIQQLYSGASSYLWSTGATTPSITIAPTATTSYIATVSNGINTCKDTVKISIHPTPVAPAAIQKQFVPTSILAVTNLSGLVSETYRIKKVANAISYDWSLKKGTLASITHLNPLGVNDTAVTVTFNACFLRDTLCVKSLGVCSSSVAKTAILYANTTPANVSAVTTLGGNFAVCIGVSKSFTAVAATPTATQTNIGRYRWTLPANVAIVSANADSSTINVQFNAGFTGGNIAVRGVNTCTGTLGAITSTTLQYLPPTPTSIVPGTGSNIACINNTISYSVLVAAPSLSQTTATLFRWTKPANTTILSATADSSSITLRFNAGFTGGVLSVKGQSSCGAQSAAKSISLTTAGCKMDITSNVASNNTNSTQVRNSSTQNLEVQLYPNPSAGSFNLKINSNKPSPIVVKVMNVNGQMVKSFLAKSNQINQIGSELKSGVYMVIIHQDDEEKVIKAVKI